MLQQMTKPASDLDDPNFVAELLARLASGESVSKVLRSYSGNLERNFWKRCYLDQTFATTIARAREAGVDSLVAETLDIADSCDETTVQSAKLKVHARQWLASKLNWKRYGDKGLLGSGNGDSTPTEITVRWASKPVELKQVTPENAQESLEG